MIRYLLATTAICFTTPVAAQTVSGCGTTAIAKASNTSIAKLTTEATCFGKARDIAIRAITIRQTRIAQLAPAPIPAPQPTTTKPAIGVNLNGIANYLNEHPFLDRFKLAGNWIISGGAYAYSSAPPELFDANGWPKGQPAGSKYSINIPLEAAGAGKHRWVLTYSGTATFDWNGRINVVSSDPGKLVFDANDVSADFGIATTDADPIHDAHLVRQDQAALLSAGQYLNPDFVAFLKHFSAIRTMDWTGTNGSQVVSWSQRAVLANAIWGGVPLEVQIAAANVAGADLWLNIPAHADDDYIRQAVTMVRDTLAPGLKLHLEYSNEVWNYQFEQSNWAQTQADAKWPADSKQWIGRQIWYGYRAAQMAKIAHDVFGATADARLSVVLGTWPGWADSYIDDATASGISKANLGTIASLFKEYAITTYFGDDLGASSGNDADRAVVVGWSTAPDGLDKAFQELEFGGLLQQNYSLAWRTSTYARHAAQAKAWGLDMVAYEGGLSWYYFMAADKGPFDSLLGRMVVDPRMGPITTKMVKSFGDAGGKLFMQFTDVGGTKQPVGAVVHAARSLHGHASIARAKGA